ncbi:hypothetical protein BD769DRAFT_1696796 [Suillus cothurnatus]|nr:hypothetical protein BD769DRAFT_1696796 [Suillus cothurnatus]
MKRRSLRLKQSETRSLKIWKPDPSHLVMEIWRGGAPVKIGVLKIRTRRGWAPGTRTTATIPHSSLAQLAFILHDAYVHQAGKRDRRSPMCCVTYTEYSANEVATARDLRFLVTYDYACSLHEEVVHWFIIHLEFYTDTSYYLKWTFLLRSHWTKVKVIYIIARYVPFFLLLTVVYLCFTPNETPDNCRTAFIIYASLFVLRTYVLWNKSRIVLAAMLSAILAVTVASIRVDFIHLGTIYGITGCYKDMQGVRMSILFVLLFALQLGVASLTLIRAMQSWRTAKCPLYTVLVKHNIFYYVCGLFLSAMNALAQTLFFNITYRIVFECLKFLILAILATRMHLSLWQINQHVHGSDALWSGPVVRLEVQLDGLVYLSSDTFFQGSRQHRRTYLLGAASSYPSYFPSPSLSCNTPHAHPEWCRPDKRGLDACLGRTSLFKRSSNVKVAPEEVEVEQGYSIQPHGVPLHDGKYRLDIHDTDLQTLTQTGHLKLANTDNLGKIRKRGSRQFANYDQLLAEPVHHAITSLLDGSKYYTALDLDFVHQTRG